MLCGLARHAAAAPAQASRPSSIRRVSGVPQQRTCRCPKSLAVPEGGTEDAEAEGANPMFNSAFSAVLQQALQRQGEEALSTGPAQVPEEQRPSAQEHVLQASMQDSRRNLIQLERMKDALEGAIEREKKQFDRLHFCYTKARDDQAYIRVMERPRN